MSKIKHCSVYVLIALFLLHLKFPPRSLDDVTGLARQVFIFSFSFFKGILQSTLPNKIWHWQNVDNSKVTKYFVN